MTRNKYIVRYFDEPLNIDSYIEYNGEYLDASTIVDILNTYEKENKELYEENKRLRKILNVRKLKLKELCTKERW